MLAAASSQIRVCLALSRAISRTRTVDEIYAAALDALFEGLTVSRASILLFDADGVMRFKAWRGLSDSYRAAVEGHTPWTVDDRDATPIVVADVTAEPSLTAYRDTILAEGIAAMAFIPLVSLGCVIGKFMLYYDEPRALSDDDLQVADLVAAQVAFAVERTRAEERTRRSEERLRFALDAASMGTWECDLSAESLYWSPGLEAMHDVAPGAFDGTFDCYLRNVHPDDRVRVRETFDTAVQTGAPVDIEYRTSAALPGRVQWIEAKGRVEYDHGRATRMSGVSMVVTPRKEAELARLAAAEEASRLKDEFLATLSHELRTPLNAIIGWVQMLEASVLSPQQREHAIHVIGRNARLQAQLIEDILDVSRVITGKLEIEPGPLLVPQLVESAISGALPAAAAKRIAVSTVMPESMPPTLGDVRRLQQVLGNVLSNAIKFTPEGGRIDVSCDLQGADAVIRVQDTGSGITEAFLPFVFDRFRQADSRSTRRNGGLGLGLAIARHIVEQHHGRITAVSNGPGLGTCIEIRLPVAFDVAHPGAQGRDRVVVPDVRFDDLVVLVVDDQGDSRDLLAAVLEDRGARVRRCESARAAIDTLETEAVSLLVADIAMPDVDGYDLMRLVRDRHPSLPAIAVSAYARAEDRMRARAAGYGGYCAKPVDIGEFLGTAREVLAMPAR